MKGGRYALEPLGGDGIVVVFDRINIVLSEG